MSKLRDLIVEVSVKSNIDEMKKIDKSMDSIADTAKDAAKEVTGLEKVFGKLTKVDMKKLSSGMQDIGKKMSKMVSLPIAGVFAGSLKAVGDFDYTMADVQAKTQATNDELKKMRDNAREVASSSIFNPQEVAAAQAGLASAGLNPEEITQTVQHSLNLATTQNIDPDQASKLITTSMAQFDLGTTEAEGVADILAAVASKTNMDNALVIGESLSMAGATAKGANTGLAETAAIFGTLANVGMEGSRAGTAFNAFQRELVANTSKTGKNHVKIGNQVIDVYDKQTGQMRSLGTILSEVTDATEGMSDEAKDAAMQDIFSGQAIQMVKMFGEAGSESFKSLKDELEGMEDGLTAGMAETKMDNIKGSIESLKSSLTDAMIVIGDVIKGPVKEAAETIGNLTDKFREMDPATQQTIIKIAALAMAAGPVIAIIGKIIGVGTTVFGVFMKMKTAIGAAGGAITIAKGAIAALTGPIGIAIAVGAGLVAAGIAIYKNWDVIKEKAAELGEGISGAWTNLKEKTVEMWEGMKTTVTNTLDTISEKWEGVKSFFKNPIKGTVNILQNVKEKFTKGKKDGDHYQGIGSIPKDNYMANLHEGEMVVDKANAGFIRSIFGMGKGRTSTKDLSRSTTIPTLPDIPTGDTGAKATPNIMDKISLPAFAPHIEINVDGAADDNAIERIRREVEAALKDYGEEFVTAIFNQLMSKLASQLL